MALHRSRSATSSQAHAPSHAPGTSTNVVISITPFGSPWTHTPLPQAARPHQERPLPPQLVRDGAGTITDVTLTALTIDGGAVRRLATLQPDDGVGLQSFTWQPIPLEDES
jgi:hypothetical protein